MNRLSISRTTVLVTLGVIVFVILLAFMITPNPPPLDDDGDPFTGQWVVNGTDALGVEYSGTLTIDAAGAGYELQWIVTGAIREGTGTLSGVALEARWREEAGIGSRREGTASYRVVDDMLIGATSIDGAPGTGTEEGFPPR